MRNPWILAQFAVAAVVLVISLIGIIGTLAFDAAESVFSFAGAIQAFAVFPGLVVSLVLNGILMGVRRAPAPSVAQKVLLGVEFALIAALLLFHFYTDEAGNTLGLAIVTWPVLILLAIVIAVIAIVRVATASPVAPAPAPPAA
jgi:hypothetical protein